MKLFCLTYAGGNSSFFDNLKEELSLEIEVIAFEYSGHATRHKEPFYKDFNELAKDAYCFIKCNLKPNEEYAIFGYSMGCISAVELLKEIYGNKEICAPKHIFLAAHEPSTNRFLSGFSDSEADEIIKERTLKFGGIPKELINNNSFWRVYMPVYKTDYTLISNYDFDNLQVFDRIPATVFYSEEDTPFSTVEDWKKYFLEGCSFVEYSGKHFFINEHYKEMAEIIRERLA